MSDHHDPRKAHTVGETPLELAAKLLEGLDTIIDSDATVEKWLHEDVVPVAIAMQTNPQQAIPAEAVFAKIRALHAERLKSYCGDGIVE